jgi:hypothetical protein
VSRNRTDVIHSLDQIPLFESEDDEDRFWSTHRFSRELLERGSAPPERVARMLTRLRAARTRDTSIGAPPSSEHGGSRRNRAESANEFPEPVKDL